jgi:signal transduction histidine kinase
MERLAQIGAIYSGLGHDLGNLLLPLRLRLDSLRRIALPPDGIADLSAIETAVSYLQQLETGLGWLTTGCNPSGDAVTSTRLRGWAVEIEPILRHALPEGAILTIDIPPRLPAIGISRPALTQAVFNLVQNAGHALRGRSDGRVVLGARRERDGKTMQIFVRDNGPGLDEEAKRRCFEPFYSCRKPGELGGLGLAIVRALARSAGGDVTVLSEAGAGATFTLAIPIARSAHENRDDHHPLARD